MKIRLLFGFGLYFLLAACSKDLPAPLPAEEAINLSNLKAGQKSIYKRYITNCGAVSSNFEYTGDVMQLEVVEEAGQLFFQETLTPESPLVKDGIITEPILHKVEGDLDKILIQERFNSLLFYFYANDTIQLRPEHDVNLVQQDCRLILGSDPFIGNDIGLAEDFSIGTISQKNKTVISCEPYESLDAYLFYDAGKLYMSHVVSLGFGDNAINGWVLEE